MLITYSHAELPLLALDISVSAGGRDAAAGHAMGARHDASAKVDAFFLAAARFGLD